MSALFTTCELSTYVMVLWCYTYAVNCGYCTHTRTRVFCTRTCRGGTRTRTRQWGTCTRTCTRSYCTRNIPVYYHEINYLQTWRQNYVIGSNEYLIFMFVEYLIPHKHTLAILCKSKHFPQRYKRKRKWVFFFWTRCSNKLNTHCRQLSRVGFVFWA